MSQAFQPPLPTFTGLDGLPLSGGYVYFGAANMDSVANPVTVYWDEAQSQVASQPLRTNAGYIVHNGSPATVWVTGSCSVLAKDSTNRQVYYVAQWDTPAIAVEDAKNEAIADIGAAKVAALAEMDVVLADAQAAQAAAETAEDNAAAESMLFSTTTAGLAAAASGQYFAVQQPYGEAGDIYLDNAGTAVSQNRTIPTTGKGQLAMQIQVAELAAGNLTPYPIAPAADFYAVDTYNRNGKYIPSRQASSAPGANLIALCSGVIAIDGYGTAASTVVDHNYATGVGGNQTAARLTIPNGNYWSPFRGILPAGTYTFSIQLKGAPGTSPTIKCGDWTNSGSVGNTALNDVSWTTVSFGFTATGSNVQWPIVVNQSGASVQVLVDRIQFYAGASVPAWSDPPSGELGNVVPMNAAVVGSFIRTTARNGNAIDTTGIVLGAPTAVAGTTGGAIRLSSYPQTKSVTEMTLLAICASDDTAIGAGKVIGDSDAFGNIYIGIWQGKAVGGPAESNPTTSVSPGNYLKLANRGYHVLAIRCKATEQSFFFDGIEYSKRVAAWGPLNVARMLAFCDSKQDRAFLGKVTMGAVFEKWLNDTEIATAIRSMKQRHILFGEPMVDTGYQFIIAEGDSITDNNAAPSNGYVTMYFNTNPARVYGKNIAVSGSTFASMNARLTEITRMAPQVLTNTGKNLILSTLIGANGVPTTTEMSTYWAAARAAGAKIVACTILPRYGVAGFEASRVAFNNWVYANPSLYDALCDFGNTSSVMGNPNSYVDTPANWNDVTHPSAAGQALMLPIWKTAVESLYT